MQSDYQQGKAFLQGGVREGDEEVRVRFRAAEERGGGTSVKPPGIAENV
jgi:hypothetical protein